MHDLGGHLIVDVAWLRSLHAVDLALAGHAILHHVGVRHVSFAM
jgi:hypothetical protein